MKRVCSRKKGSCPRGERRRRAGTGKGAGGCGQDGGAVRGAEPRSEPGRAERVPGQEELSAVLNPPGTGAEGRLRRRQGVSLLARRRQPAGSFRTRECSPGHEIFEAKGKARQAAGKDSGRRARRAVCLCRVPRACAFAYHGEGLDETVLETLF